MGADATASQVIWHVVKTYWSLLLGNALEWYEFVLYSFLEPYIEEHFFRGSAVATWLGYAVTFTARPFGGILLGLVGDLFGRKVSTFLSMFGMLFATVLQGMLPTFHHGPTAGSIGVSILVLLRFLQGISAGGEIASVSTYIMEVSHPHVLARTLLLISVSATIGTFCAQFISFLGEEILGEEVMIAWGWRVPFLLAIIPGIASIMGRRCIPESKSFMEEKSKNKHTISPRAKTRELLTTYWPKVLVGIGSSAAIAVIMYGGMQWGLVSLKKKGMSSSCRILAGCGSNFVQICMLPLAGYLADLRGAAWVQMFGSLFAALVGLPLMLIIQWSVLEDNPWTAVCLHSMGYGVVSSFLTMQKLQICELFPVGVRNAGMGLSYGLGMAFFGGLAPMMFEALSFSFWLPGLLMSLGAFVTSMTTLVSLGLQSLGRMQLTHLRHEPYFRCCGRECFAFPITEGKDSQHAPANPKPSEEAYPHKESISASNLLEVCVQ